MRGRLTGTMRLEGALLLSGGILILALAASCLAEGGAESLKHRFVRADELRDHPGFCFDSKRCALRKEGESWTVDESCESATCYLVPNGTLVEKRTRCDPPSPIFTEDCYIVRVEGMPYPDCCPRLFCDEKEKKSFFFKK